MKKRKQKIWIIIITIALALIALITVATAALALVVGMKFFGGNELDTGRVVECDGGVYVIAYDDGQFLQMNSSASKLLFEALETGDKILILRSSAIAMSYPGQCYVKLCFTLSKGTVDDVPSSVIDELERIGWID